MIPNVLVDLQFQELLAEAHAQTSTGSEFLQKHQAYILDNPTSCSLVNSFIKEGMTMRYDEGIKNVVDTVCDYINSNKVGWAIASVCENIKNGSNKHNYLNINAANKAQALLELNEEEIVKQVKAGAMKDIMFCESFRNIANEVFKATKHIVESNSSYTKITPVSMVEQVDESIYFVVEGRLYCTKDNQVKESKDWGVVSHTFTTVESLLESSMCTVQDDDITIKYNKQEYVISEQGTIKHGEKTMSVSELREENGLYVRATHINKKKEVDQVLEAIALLCENYDKVVLLDNTGIYCTGTEKFLVIECGSQLYARALQGALWEVNESAMTTLDFIKSKTRVNLSEEYSANIKSSIEEASAQERANILEQQATDQILSLKERIAVLTEKFKDDPTKLNILSKLATDISDI